MKLIAPDYYNDFHCIAEKCAYNCCIGWEIDIDEYTLSYYDEIISDTPDRLDEKFVKRLSDGIVRTDNGETACFKLGENERCPFLNKNNLCDIILTLGEDALCGICTDHPRFRTFYSDRTEIGTGLCCEEAARLILGRQDKSVLTALGDDNGGETADEYERSALDMRERIFEILQNRCFSIEQRTEQLLKLCNSVIPEKTQAEWADIFLSLERLDEKWGDILLRYKDCRISQQAFNSADKWEIVFEQLLVYLTYRHFINGAMDGNTTQTAAFIVLSYRLIRNLLAAEIQQGENPSFEDIAELARMFSSEIEYSDVNIQALMKIM